MKIEKVSFNKPNTLLDIWSDNPPLTEIREYEIRQNVAPLLKVIRPYWCRKIEEFMDDFFYDPEGVDIEKVKEEFTWPFYKTIVNYIYQSYRIDFVKAI